MTFSEILSQTIEMLNQYGRVSYRALKRQFDLDEDYLEDLKEALTFSYPQTRDEEGRGLVCSGELSTSPSYSQPETDKETRFHALLPEFRTLPSRSPTSCHWHT